MSKKTEDDHKTTIRQKRTNNQIGSIRKLRRDEKIPFGLLLIADETIDAIKRYIFSCEIFVYEECQKQIGLYALQKVNTEEAEIKNICVRETWQGLGIGTLLLRDAAERARAQGFKSLLIGTGDGLHRQLKLYQREGFAIFEVKRGFFLKNYRKPIFEEGHQLIDMIILKKDLQ